MVKPYHFITFPEKTAGCQNPKVKLLSRMMRVSELGLRTVAIYSEVDCLGSHSLQAHEAYRGRILIQGLSGHDGIVALALENRLM